MKYNQKKYEYNREYTRTRIKRIVLDLQPPKYERIKETSARMNESMAGFVKKAVDQRLQRIEDGAEVPEETRDD